MGNELKKVYIDNDGVEWDLNEDIGEIKVDIGCDEEI